MHPVNASASIRLHLNSFPSVPLPSLAGLSLLLSSIVLSTLMSDSEEEQEDQYSFLPSTSDNDAFDYLPSPSSITANEAEQSSPVKVYHERRSGFKPIRASQKPRRRLARNVPATRSTPQASLLPSSEQDNGLMTEDISYWEVEDVMEAEEKEDLAANAELSYFRALELQGIVVPLSTLSWALQDYDTARARLKVRRSHDVLATHK